MQRKRTILIYGRSRSGKSTLIDELAEYLFITTKKPTLLYTIDKGGYGVFGPSIELGIVQIVEQGSTDPWIFMNMACQGMVRDAQGKWVKADLSKYAMVAFESLTGFSDAFMIDLAGQAAKGVNIGGSANVSFTVQGDGLSLKIGGNNQGHYQVVQNRVLAEFLASSKLDVPYLVWTASSSKDDDTQSTAKVIGPQVAGKALTAEMVRHIDMSFRVDCLPSKGADPERHVLYLGNSVDITAGNAVGLGNDRVPFGASKLPTTVEPASLVHVLQLIEKAEKEAQDAKSKRIAAGKFVNVLHPETQPVKAAVNKQ